MIISVLISIGNANNIKSQFEYEYYNKTIQCSNGENCEIRCNHISSCQYSKIKCADNYDCSIYFTASSSGAYTDIFAYNSSNLLVISSVSYAITHATIYAPQQTLNLSCDYQSCHNTDIYTLNTHEIIADCHAYGSCQYLRLFADDVSVIDVLCAASYSCQYMKIYQQSPLSPSQLNLNCGANGCPSSLIKSNSDTLSIYCSGCYDSNIYYVSTAMDTNATIWCQVSGGCQEVDLYAPEGIFDVSVYGDTAQSNLKLHCGETYYESCDLQPDIGSNNMLCDSNAFCMNYEYNPSTDYNIIVSNDYGKYNDSIECDSNVKHCTVYCYGMYSCAYSDIICAVNNPNGTCTIYCGNNGCIYANIRASNVASLILYSKYNNALQSVSIEAVNIHSHIEVHCDHSYACYDMDFTATNTPQINIECIGSSGCSYSDIYYISDGNYNDGYIMSSNIILSCDGSSSCERNTINSNSGYLDLGCNGASSCNYLSLYCPEASVLVDESDISWYCDVTCASESCQGMDLYSINGWNNVRVISVDDKFPHLAKMYCDPAYSTWCNMQGNVDSDEWYCDESEICSHFRLDLNATQIIVQREYQYYNQSIQCETDKDCYIYCGKREGCSYATISCSNMNCSVYCFDVNSCYKAVITASMADILSIYSSYSSAAAYATIYAPNNRLNMECSTSSSSCYNQNIYASNTDHISMSCLSSSSCSYQLIFAENAKIVEWNCIGDSSCTHSELYQYLLPEQEYYKANVICEGTWSCYRCLLNTKLELDLLCDSASSCQETDVYVANNESFKLECTMDTSCLSININSIKGFETRAINITSYDDTYANTAEFYCGYGQTKKCALNGLINSNQWVCSDTSNDCYGYQPSDDDTDHILLDYDYKYSYKYIHCDENKTNCDVICKASTGCYNSRIICPINTNHGSCSVYCDAANSCYNLDIYAINGYSQLEVDCNGNDAYCSGITIYCTASYNETCHLDSNGQCIGFCGNYTWNATETLEPIDLSFATNAFYPNDSYIIVSSAWQHYNDSIVCTGNINNNTGCSVICSNTYSCAYSSIAFVGSDLDCYVSCTGSASCQYVTINGANCNSLRILGSYSSTLQWSTVYSSQNILNIDCLSQSCSYMKVYDNSETDTSLLSISISCSSSYACNNQYWSIHSAQSVVITCSSGSYSCSDSDYFIYSVPTVLLECLSQSSCYSNIFNTDSNQLTIDCAEYDACYQSQFYIPENTMINCNHTDACKQLSIYSVKGSNAINIISTPNNSWANSNQIYCGESHVESCALRHDEGTTWNCDVAAFCYDFTVNDSSVVAVYSYQFHNDEIVCDGDTNCNIYCRADYGCQYATIRCPEHADYSCNIYCGLQSCKYSTIYGGNGSLSLKCYNSESCSDAILHSPTTGAASIDCIGSYSCARMQVFGEHLHSLDIQCRSSYSCEYMDIYQQYIDSSLTTTTTNVDCSSSQSCVYMVLLSNAYKASIVCNKDQSGDSACQNMDIYYDGLTENGMTVVCGNTWSCYGNNFYILNGEYGINITTFSSSNAETNTLHCCSLYTESCTLKAQILSDEWICNDADSLCAGNNNTCAGTGYNIIGFEHDYQHYNQTIQCDNNKHCEIICFAQYSCAHSTIYCPTDYDCKVMCIGQYSCQKATIDAVYSNSLWVQSSGDSALSGAIMYSPINNNVLNLECIGSRSCSALKLYAAYSYIDALICFGSESCEYMRIDADYASYVDWRCIAYESCRDSMMFHHEPSALYFNLECLGYYSCREAEVMVAAQSVVITCADASYTCYGSKLYCNSPTSCNITCNSNTGCYDMDIYAVQPLKTLNVMRGDTVFDASTITLHCGFVYERYCTLIATNHTNALLCESEHSCNEYTLDYVNTDYILHEWTYLNYRQNVTCNDSKVNCEVYCLGQSGCQYNTIHCPTNSNTQCKIYGGISSFRDAIFYADSIDLLDIYSGGGSTFTNSLFHVVSRLFRYDDDTTSYGLQGADIYLDTENAKFECGPNGCSGVSLMVPSNGTNIVLKCSESNSCYYISLNMTGDNTNAEILCDGYSSCQQMDVYINDMSNNIFLNCSGSYSCDSTELYSPTAIEYSSLDCGTSTSCTSLTTHCDYPKLNKDCLMEYQDPADVWICNGDICYYDKDCVDYKKLKLRPKRGSMLGGDTIVIDGPCYNPNVNYSCTFGTEESDLYIINSTHGYCISPAASQSGTVLFAVQEDNEWFGMISTFKYHDLFDDHDVNVENIVFMNTSNDTFYSNSSEYNEFIDSLIAFDYFISDSYINMTWDVLELDHLAPVINITLHQILPYYNAGFLYFQSKFLTYLAIDVVNDGHTEIYLNYTDISALNISDEWNVFYPNVSSLSHIFVIMIESRDSESSLYYRVPSKFIQHIPLNATIPFQRRRRRLILPVLLGFAARWAVKKAIKTAAKKLGVHCAVWKFLDEQIFGDWWNKRGMQNCPDTDPSENIESGNCEGPWEVDGGCNKNKKEKCDKYHTGADSCIRSPQGQQCCYTKGKLCTNPPCAGTADIAPVFGLSVDGAINDATSGNFGAVADTGWKFAKHYFGDVLPYEWCKAATWNDNVGIQDYYDRRPQDKDGGGGTAEEACAPAGGDPHFVTFDLFNYTFNGIGDYYYLYHNNFKILIRMKQFNNGSVIQSFGMEIDIESSSSFNRSSSAIIDTLEVAINDEESILNVYLKGEMMLFSDDLYGINMKVGDIDIKYTPFVIIIRCEFGVFIEIWLRNVNDLMFLEFTVDVDAKYQNTVRGLIGNYDENDRNDLQSRNGTILDVDHTNMEQIHFDFGLSWLLDDASDNNIFHIPFISDIDPFQYQPLFGFDDVDDALLQLAEEKCGSHSFECIFDVVATNVVEIANTTLKFVEFAKETAENIKTIYNVTEIITPSPTIEGCSVSASMNVYVLVDSNCNMTTSECNDQQTFITTFLQRIKSMDDNMEQIFGYIEYGNGAKELISIRDNVLNDDFASLLQSITKNSQCNSLNGAINHPLYAIHTAMDRFKNMDNNYNNIIVLISSCPTTSQIDPSCSMLQTFYDENIQLFAINTHHNETYECLVNNINDQILNMDSYNVAIDSAEELIYSICSWNGFTQHPTSNPTQNPLLSNATLSPTTATPTTGGLTPTTTTATTDYNDDEGNEDEANRKGNSNEGVVIALVLVISLFVLCILGHWFYIYKLKKHARMDPQFNNLKSVELHETQKDDALHKPVAMETLKSVEDQETPN